MKKSNSNTINVFFSGAVSGISFFPSYKSNRRKRIESLRKKINAGFEADRENFEIDMLNIRNDFSNAYNKLTPQLNETV
jgi:hypothetical protein